MDDIKITKEYIGQAYVPLFTEFKRQLGYIQDGLKLIEVNYPKVLVKSLQYEVDQAYTLAEDCLKMAVEDADGTDVHL